MKQISIIRYFDEEQKAAEYRYALSIHYSRNEVDSIDQLVQWLTSRFELWVLIYPEVSEEGRPHLQCYGETRHEFTKADRRPFQKKGAMNKYLHCDIEKPFACAVARRSRYYNAMYILKTAECEKWLTTPWMCTETDREIRFEMYNCSQDYQGEIRANARRAEHSESYEAKVIRWWLDIPVDKRPTQVCHIARLMLECDMVPWSKYDVPSIGRIARYLKMQYTDNDSREQGISHMEDLVHDWDRNN